MAPPTSISETRLTQQDARRLATRIADLERLVRGHSRTVQLAYSSIDDGALGIVDSDGVDRGTIGVLPDGTTGILATNGPTPPQPTPPTLMPVVTALSVAWDGSFTHGDVRPLDLARIEVHVGANADFVPDGTTIAGTMIGHDGDTVMVASGAGVSTYVRLVAVSTSGAWGAPSAAAHDVAESAGHSTSYYQGSEPTGAVDNDVWVDSDDGNRTFIRSGAAWVEITDQRILDALAAARDAQATADGKIRTFSQAAAPTGMTAADVGDLWYESDAGNLLYRWSGSDWIRQPIGGGGIGAGAVQPGSPIVAPLAIASAQIADLKADKITAGSILAAITVSGRLATSLTGARVELNGTGLRAYNAAGTNTVSILNTGAASFAGSVHTGSTISGSTITGSLIRATGSGDVSAISTGHALQIGPTSSLNIAIDGNEIQSRYNGAKSNMSINASGGNIFLGQYGVSQDIVGANNRVQINDPFNRDTLVVSSNYDDLYTGSAIQVLMSEETNPANFNVLSASVSVNSGPNQIYRLRGDGTALADGSWQGGGADFAEMFETSAEPVPIGRAVTLVEGKLRLAGPADFVLGVTSATPTVVGNNPLNWPNRYLRDPYGRVLLDGDGRPTTSPAFDANLAGKYIPRSDRPEWVAVALIGQVVADDDGTCEVDGFAKTSAGGVLTASTTDGYLVIDRVDDTHVRVLVMPLSPGRGASRPER